MAKSNNFTPEEFIDFHRTNIEPLPEEQHLSTLKKIVPSFGNVEALQDSISYRKISLEQTKQRIDNIIQSKNLDTGGWDLKSLQEQSSDYTQKIIALNKMNDLVERHKNALKQSSPSLLAERLKDATKNSHLFKESEYKQNTLSRIPSINTDKTIDGIDIRDRKRLPPITNNDKPIDIRERKRLPTKKRGL